MARSIGRSRRLIQPISRSFPQLEEENLRLFPRPSEVSVLTHSSLISGGTESATTELATASLFSKARARPDLVKKVVDKVRNDGLRESVATVRNRLDQSIPLGYSAAGEILAVGEGVEGVRPGQRVATAGEGHAELQTVSGNLVVPIPEGLSFEEGAFAGVASIAMNAIRLAGLNAGSRVLVVGLGLVGALAAKLCIASGALVVGIDPMPWKRERASKEDVICFESDDDGWLAALNWTRGQGFDAILVAAATRSSAPMRRAAHAVRESGTIVLVGDAGMDLERRPLYEREVTIKVARSYGPGRYDPTYEELGIDYPYGQVRWTAQRNMEAFLDLLSSGRITVRDLVTHRYKFEDAPEAYKVLEDGGESHIGIILKYDTTRVHSVLDRASEVSTKSPESQLSAGLVGAGRFAREILIPAAQEAGFGPWTRVFSTTGSGATAAAGQFGFEEMATEPDEVIGAEDTPTVLIATRHDSHADLTARALKAGKHVFCEKPLALTEEELELILDAWQQSPGILLVGFNRRWSPAVSDALGYLGNRQGPLQILYRVNAGSLPDDHWLRDPRMGGRLIGEACHFVDTCNAVANESPTQVTTLTSGRGELLMDEDFTIVLGYRDGSQATVVYSSESSSKPGKERIEILGRNRTIIIDDFRRLDSYAPSGHKVHRYGGQDKGHQAELRAFAEAVRGERDAQSITHTAVETTSVMFAAIESAMTGATVKL